MKILEKPKSKSPLINNYILVLKNIAKSDLNSEEKQYVTLKEIINSFNNLSKDIKSDSVHLSVNFGLAISQSLLAIILFANELSQYTWNSLYYIIILMLTTTYFFHRFWTRMQEATNSFDTNSLMLSSLVSEIKKNTN